MASIMRNLAKAVVISSLINLGAPALKANDLDFDRSEIPDPEALKAYKRFWDAFQGYEMQKKKAAVEEYQRTREGLETLYNNQEKALVQTRIDTLTKSIAKYNENLEKTPSADNRPYVLLNLAQMYGELASIQESIGDDSAKTTRVAALNILRNLDENHPSFAHGTEALYLRASLLEANGDKQIAHTIWVKLAATGSDKYSIHGNIAAGDNEFENASPDKAIVLYEKARTLLAKLEDVDKGLDELRIYYRLAWANFKAGKNKDAINAAVHIITPGIISKSVRQRERIARDVAELIGYSLYELDSDAATKQILNNKDLQAYAPAVSLVLMEQQLTAGFAQKVISVSELAVARFPLSREYPDILRIKARAEELAGRMASRLETLEKLSMLLPQKSLWRNKHQSSNDVIRYMEDLARNATESVAASYYQEGLTSGNARKFHMAAAHYKILLDDQAASERAPALRLKIANCQFFAGNLADAANRYAELINELKTPDEILTTAHYQQVLTMEKLWRVSFESAAQKNLDPVKNEQTLKALKNLEESVDQHANRFPSQSRSVDLLLVAASANRDHNRFDDATKFWQRVLLSNPSTGQRSMALRGLIFAKIRAGKPAEVIETVSKFLQLEENRTLGQSLQMEMLGVLASATKEEAQRLSKSGTTAEAAAVLLRTVADFGNVPDRDQMWRDGAYFQAISGNWAGAQKSSEQYLQERNVKQAGDMTYLLARSHEYQLRFNEAVKFYLKLAEKFPNHPRSLTSLDRAEKLATGEENYAAAAKATKMKAARSKQIPEKLGAYDSAVSYLVLAGQNAEAMSVAEQRRNSSKTTAEKLEGEIKIAKVRYDSGEKQMAVDDLDSIDKQIERSKYNLGDAYKRLAADVGMVLGEHAISEFKEQKLSDSEGDVSNQVEKKSKLFTEIVTRLDKVAAMDQPELSAKARFSIAQAANDFADELTAIPSRAGEPITLKSHTRFSQNIGRLRDMAKRYHGNNILAKQRSPQLYAKNDWVKRSALALSRSGGEERQSKAQVQTMDQLSTASSVEMPQQWSH